MGRRGVWKLDGSVRREGGRQGVGSADCENGHRRWGGGEDEDGGAGGGSQGRRGVDRQSMERRSPCQFRSNPFISHLMEFQFFGLSFRTSTLLPAAIF